MRSKGTEAVRTLEGDPPEDGGMSSSVPRGGISSWVSGTTNSNPSSDVLYVNLEGTFPPSPPFLERDPNMGSTARYSPLHGAPATLPPLPPIQHTSLLPAFQPNLNNVKSISTNAYNDDNCSIIAVGSYSLPTNNGSQADDINHSVISHYIDSCEHDVTVLNNNLQTEKLTPLLPSIDDVNCETDVQNDTNGAFYSQQLYVSRDSFGITNVENVYLQSEINADSNCSNPILHSTTTEMELIYPQDGGYVLEENTIKNEHVELLLNSAHNNMPYTLSKENSFIITCSPESSCEIVKGDNVKCLENNLFKSMEDSLQYDNDQNVMNSINIEMMHSNLGDSEKNNSIKCIEENTKFCNNRKRKQLSDIDISITCIPDKSVPCRAKASLPATHLLFCNTNDKESSILGVFARRRIPIRARFGPLEGIRKIFSEDSPIIMNGPQFLLHTKSGNFTIDVSDENTSNWMRYVRFSPGPNQNVCLQQLEDNLYFTTSKPISPNCELLLGYGNTYARDWGLPLVSQIDESIIDWPCFECSMRFVSSEELQNHLNVHDGDDLCNLSRCKKKGNRDSSSETHCDICNRTFPRTYSLRRHMRTHEVNAGINTKIQTPNKLEERRDVINNIDKEDINSKKDSETGIENKVFTELIENGFFNSLNGNLDEMKCNEGNDNSIATTLLNNNFQNTLSISINDKPNDNHEKNGNNTFTTLKDELKSKRLQSICLLCNISFLSEALLSNHVHEKHRETDGSYKCVHCYKNFADYGVLKKHIRRNHFKQKVDIENDSMKISSEFSCPHCKKEFKRKDKLKEHVKKQQRLINNGKEVIFMCAEKPSGSPSDSQADSKSYASFTFKCHPCHLGFKRRGMLVNHLARRHPEISRASVPELQLPIYKTARDYFCQHCDKVYKSSSKRKAHILKNHPGESLPPSGRELNAEQKEVTLLGYSTCVGSVTSAPHHCPYTPCHKQYASKAKLSQHIRHTHMSTESLENQKDNKNIDNQKSHDEELENETVENPAHLTMEVDNILQKDSYMQSLEKNLDDDSQSRSKRQTSPLKHLTMNKNNSDTSDIIDNIAMLMENSVVKSEQLSNKEISNENFINEFSDSIIGNLTFDQDKITKNEVSINFDKTTFDEFVYNNTKTFPLMLLLTGGLKVVEKTESMQFNLFDKNSNNMHVNGDTSKLHISSHILSMGSNKLLNVMSKNHFVENSYSSQYTDR